MPAAADRFTRPGGGRDIASAARTLTTPAEQAGDHAAQIRSVDLGRRERVVPALRDQVAGDTEAGEDLQGARGWMANAPDSWTRSCPRSMKRGATPKAPVAR